MTPIEPSANHRKFASEARQAFTALVQNGFTEQQAIQLTGALVIGLLADSHEEL